MAYTKRGKGIGCSRMLFYPIQSMNSSGNIFASAIPYLKTWQAMRKERTRGKQTTLGTLLTAVSSIHY